MLTKHISKHKRNKTFSIGKEKMEKEKQKNINKQGSIYINFLTVNKLCAVEEVANRLNVLINAFANLMNLLDLKYGACIRSLIVDLCFFIIIFWYLLSTISSSNILQLYLYANK